MKKIDLIPALALLVTLVFIFRPHGRAALDFEPKLAQLRARSAALMEKRPPEVTEGSLTTIVYHIEEARRFHDREKNYAERNIASAEKYLERAERGEDPLAPERGIVARGYRSPFSALPQPYSVYVPEGYREDKRYGLVLNLHGGSSTHNLFLAVTLGNWGLPWKSYWQVRHDVFTPHLEPEDYLVAAPDGFGQLRWRWMAERDVLDVVRDIRLHYSIDPKRVALCGLSNGGIGAYAVGTKHASSFSGVFSMAGISDWLRFHKSSAMAGWSKKINKMESGLYYAMNAKNTYYHFVHGEKDAGPMKVAQARAMHERLEKLGIDHVYHEVPDFGHDIIWVLWGKGRIFDYVDKHPKAVKPDEVWLETLSYRADRQHWLELRQMRSFLETARIRAVFKKKNNTVRFETENVESLVVHLFESPVDWKKPARFEIGGKTLTVDAVPPDGMVVLHDEGGGWKAAGAAGHEPSWKGTLRKVKGLSGPATDINYGRQIHVYGSQVESDVKALEHAAALGARNWMKAKQFVEVDFPVKSDDEVTDEDIRSAHLVLYGTWKENGIIRRIGEKLPIKILDGGIELRGTLYGDADVGAVLVYPNPLNRKKYVLLITGNSIEAVKKGNEYLPFLPDYLVFDRKSPSKPLGMAVSKHHSFIEAGFFDEWWKLPPEKGSAP